MLEYFDVVDRKPKYSQNQRFVVRTNKYVFNTLRIYAKKIQETNADIRLNKLLIMLFYDHFSKDSGDQ